MKSLHNRVVKFVANRVHGTANTGSWRLYNPVGKQKGFIADVVEHEKEKITVTHEIERLSHKFTDQYLSDFAGATTNIHNRKRVLACVWFFIPNCKTILTTFDKVRFLVEGNKQFIEMKLVPVEKPASENFWLRMAFPEDDKIVNEQEKGE